MGGISGKLCRELSIKKKEEWRKSRKTKIKETKRSIKRSEYYVRPQIHSIFNE